MRHLAVLAALLLAVATPLSSRAGEVVGVCFVPGPKDCAAAVVAEIDGASTSILVQAYSFTHDGIAAALVRAKGRGLVVGVVLDKSNVCAGADGPDDEEAQACRRKGSRIAETLAKGGVAVRIDRRHAIAHSKTMVIDARRVLTGSLNWTTAGATKNAENLVVLDGADVAALYAAEWAEHWGHSDPYGKEK